MTVEPNEPAGKKRISNPADKSLSAGGKPPLLNIPTRSALILALALLASAATAALYLVPPPRIATAAVAATAVFAAAVRALNQIIG